MSCQEQDLKFCPFTSDSLKKNGSVLRHVQACRALEEGKRLPKRLRRDFSPSHFNTPLEEVDRYYSGKKTFIVIGKNYEIWRFSATDALEILCPLNIIRRRVIFLLVHPWFSRLINGIFLINSFMMLPTAPFILPLNIFFTAIYTIEIAIRVLARGFILQRFTYLREPWNWLDFIVTILAYITILIDYTKLVYVGPLRVIRLVKLATFVPGLKIFAKVIIRSVIQLKELVITSVFVVWVMALLFLRLYMGVMTRRCVKDFPSLTAENSGNFFRNESNWYPNSMALCGNSTGAQMCKPGYTCVEGYGENPDFGYTNFDNFGSAFLSVFRTMTRDSWKNLYQMLMATVGIWNALFFLLGVFTVALNIMNLLISVLIGSYKEIIEENKIEAIEEEYGDVSYMLRKLEEDGIEHLNRDSLYENNFKSDSPTREDEDEDEEIEEDTEKLDSTAQESESIGTFQKCLALIVLNPFVEIFFIFCIILNSIFLILHNSKTVIRGNYFFIAVFGLEISSKLIANGPKLYFKDNWNRFDFVVVAVSLMGLGFIKLLVFSFLRSVILLRLLRTSSCSSLHSLITIMIKSLSDLTNLCLMMFVVIFVFSVLGTNFFSVYYVANIDKFPKEWNFIDFPHSSMSVFRIICGEWIQLLWNCLLVSGKLCIPYFLLLIFVGNFIVRNLFLVVILNCQNTPPQIDDYCTRIWKAFGVLNGLLKRTRSKIRRKDSVGVTEQSNIIKTNTREELLTDTLPDCCPETCNELMTCLKPNGFWRVWTYLRYKTLIMIETVYFKSIVTLMIVLSSVALALKDKYLPDKPYLQHFLSYMDTVFTGLFLFEMLVVLFALGFKQYLRLRYLDLLVVLVLLVNFGLKTEKLAAVRILRLLRIPQIFNCQLLKCLVNTIVEDGRRIFFMLLLSLFIWLKFVVIGVHLFDFENIRDGFLKLLKVATFQGWLEIVDVAIREGNIYMLIYLTVFIIIGSFFTLSMFIGIIVDSYREQRIKGKLALHMVEPILTSDLIDMLLSKEPIKVIPKPKDKLQVLIFEQVSKQSFEIVMLVIVMINLGILALEHYQQTENFASVLYYCSVIFVVIFSMECLLKIFALRQYYFSKLWNIFDLVILILSIIELVISDLDFLSLPALVRIFRFLKIRKLLSTMKITKNIPSLFSTVLNSLFSLVLICFLLFIVMFIYAVFGMFYFKDNFQTFGQSLLLLMQLSTWSEWDKVLEFLTDQNRPLAIAYLTSFLFVSLIINSLYLSVICYNYKKISCRDLKGLSEDDFDNFYKIWQQFDPKATKYIHIDQLPDFLNALEPPFHMDKPSKYEIILLNIPIREGDLVLCTDVLASILFKHLYHEPEAIDGFCLIVGDAKEQITSTLLRERENFCASIIQNNWRRYKHAIRQETLIVDENRPKVVLIKNKTRSRSKSVDV